MARNSAIMRIPNNINVLLAMDGVDAALPPTASQCAKLVTLKLQEYGRAPMKETIRVDPKKNVFAPRTGRFYFARSCRDRSSSASCRSIGGASSQWRPVAALIPGRELERADHEVRLFAPRYVKPSIKQQKNDAADADAIVEAALRPTMRSVAVAAARSRCQPASAARRPPPADAKPHRGHREVGASSRAPASASATSRSLPPRARTRSSTRRPRGSC